MTTTALKFSLVLGQRLPWPVLQSNAIATESFGFDGLFLVDHFFGRIDVNEPTHEGYTMLAGIAAHTSRVRLGLMVAGNTYRNPVVLLKQAIGVDHISNGRLDFGVGAGWAEREHEAYSFAFPGAKVRVDMFGEALAIWKSLQTQPRTDFAGEHYQIVDAPFEPKSLQGSMPVLIGGTKPRMLRLVAEYADVWNCTAGIDEAVALNQQLTELCRDVGRDPGSIERSISPDLNLLASVEDFKTGVARYHDAGFTHITMPWPRVDGEMPVLQEIAANHLQEFRSNPTSPGAPSYESELASTEAGLRQYGYPAPAVTDWSGVQAILLGQPHWPLIAYLTERPGQLISGDELKTAFGLATHADVSRAFGEMGAAIAPASVIRPWLEGPRGWLIDAPTAAALTR
jgi:alkanesulfonate monooxygenase SsuD/methylene tetrahydromethanopterin reductase-like flavin-dependent oxidoreductase (luciferase family)